MTTAPKQPHRVVIVGAGFGGLETAFGLAGAPVQITLIDRRNHHLFQPLLYQVATASLATSEIAWPIRYLLRGRREVTTLFANVKGVDAAGKRVLLDDGDALPYDTLVLATGARHAYFGHDEWEPFAPGLKTLEDATTLRRRILVAFERAERETDPAKRDALLTFVIIGAGPTGVEMAGTLAEIARHTLEGEFRHIDPSSAEVLLIEGGPRVLQAMPESLSQRAQDQLQKLGVQVRLNARVTSVDATGLQVESPFSDGGAGVGSHRIECNCVVWAAGVAASPLGRLLADGIGVETDRAGRIKVLADLSLPGHPDISVVGDLAAAMSHRPGREPKPVPGVSPGAKQMGRAAADNILRRIAGQPTEPFRYRDYGNLATIGRNSAVVDLGTPFGPLRFSGRTAWLFWLFAHVYFLIGFRNRIVVLMDWASAYWSFQRYARVVADVRARGES